MKSVNLISDNLQWYHDGGCVRGNSLSMHCGIVEENPEICIIINITLLACFV